MTKRLVIFIFLICSLPALIYAAVTDYLILEDIGSYKLFTGVTGRVFSGPPSKYSQSSTGGILEAAGHFSESDVSYEASYTEPDSKWPFVKVEVTKHAGSDSDKWLLHEVEDGFRDPDVLNSVIAEGGRIREINGNKIFFYGGGVVAYNWLSNNVVVNIQYTNLSGPKSEPLEIVQAYLRKHSSTITLTDTEIKSKAHNEIWIKDEMERRLWLCDKWFFQLQLQKVELKKVLQESVDHMNVFLDYREKYYGIKASDEKQILWGYLQANNGTAIKNKLKEYKDWWEENKDKPINL